MPSLGPPARCTKPLLVRGVDKPITVIDIHIGDEGGHRVDDQTQIFLHPVLLRNSGGECQAHHGEGAQEYLENQHRFVRRCPHKWIEPADGAENRDR